MWADSWVSDLDPTEKLLWVYLLTNPYTEITGVYELPIRTIAFETGLDKDIARKVIERFERDGKVQYIDGWVVLTNFMRYQNTENIKIQKGIERALSELPKHVRDRVSIGYPYPTDGQSHLDSDLDLDLDSNLTGDKKSERINTVKYTPRDRELAGLLLALIRDRNPGYREPNMDKWSDEVRLMRERDGRTEKQIEYLIRWSQENSFWRANILSTAKLREKWDTLVAQVQRDTGPKQVKQFDVL